MPRLLRRAALLVAGATLLVPSGAQAANVTANGGVVTLNADAGFSDLIYLQEESPTSVLFRTNGSQFDASLPAGCNFVDVEFGFYRRFRCNAVGTITRVVVNLGDLNDTVAFWTFPNSFALEAHGGDGADNLNGGKAGDALYGEGGSDTLRGDEANDLLDGGADRDFLTGNAGADDLIGGDGFDVAMYTDRPADRPVSVSLDGSSDDGEAGENDNARADVEDVFGGAGNDTIVGSAAANELDGGSGNDVIDGGAGTDKLTGGSGNDTLLARDGNPERVDCSQDFGGGDADNATTDSVDDVSGCETNSASADLQPDKDGDGFLTPADCNDNTAAINPGAADVPDDGVDQNCDGVDAQVLDRDGDGFNRGIDCDDGNANAKPNGTEVLGNEIDENCDGFAPPIPVIETPVNSGFDFFKGRTTVLGLSVGEMEAGTTVTVRCKGGKKKGCKIKSKKKTFKKKTKGYNLFKYFRRARLKRGATIEVEITKPGFVGRLVQFKAKAKASPTPKPLCINPGQTKAQEC